jgi:DNA-binding transcriptional MocR family regulator
METLNFSLNYPLPHPVLMSSLAEKIKSDPLAAMRNVSEETLQSCRNIAARWMKVAPEQIAFGIGGHHIFSSILQEFTEPGDILACEEITYNGWIEASHFLGRKIISVKMDQEGMIPEALEELAQDKNLKGIFLMPSLHNPLSLVMRLERRKAIVEVCRRHDLFVIDDDAYRFLNPTPPLSFAHLYPEKSFWIQSFTKILFPSIKTGVVAAPVEMLSRLKTALRYQPPGHTLPWICDLMNSGKMDEVIQGKQEEARRRQAMASEVLKGLSYETSPTSFHLWMTVPAGWVPQGMTVMPATRYYAGRGPAPSAMRLTLAGENDISRMKLGLEMLADQLRP